MILVLVIFGVKKSSDDFIQDLSNNYLLLYILICSSIFCFSIKLTLEKLSWSIL